MQALIALLLALMSCAGAQTMPPQEGLYAAHASSAEAVRSLDGKNVVSLRRLDDNADDFPTEVKVQSGDVSMTRVINSGLDAEILWSEDSKAFSITGSLGGANGPYETDVFILKSDRLVRIPLTRLIELAFGHPVKCGWPERPNVGAIKWLHGSRRLLVAAEIVAHSNCDSMGTFRGFVVDVRTRRIVKSYNQLMVKRLFWADLGRELKDADDSCIRDPQSCFVPYNHRKLSR